MKKYRFFVWVLLAVAGCQPSSLEEFQMEGTAQMRLLLQDLRRIESREDLLSLLPALQKRFDKLVDLMIEARSFQQKNGDQEISFQEVNPVLNQSLLEELRRVYALEGGRECLEKAQKEPMLRLAVKEKALEKQRGLSRGK